MQKSLKYPWKKIVKANAITKTKIKEAIFTGKSRRRSSLFLPPSTFPLLFSRKAGSKLSITQPARPNILVTDVSKLNDANVLPTNHRRLNERGQPVTLHHTFLHHTVTFSQPKGRQTDRCAVGRSRGEGKGGETVVARGVKSGA